MTYKGWYTMKERKQTKKWKPSEIKIKTNTCQKSIMLDNVLSNNTKKYPSKIKGGIPHSVMAKVLNYKLVGTEFKPLLLYYIHIHTNILGKDMNPLIPSYRLNSTTAVIQGWLWH